MTRCSSSGWERICRWRLVEPALATGPPVSSGVPVGSELTEYRDHFAEDAPVGRHRERRHRRVLGNELDGAARAAEPLHGGLVLGGSGEPCRDAVAVVGDVLAPGRIVVEVEDVVDRPSGA